MTFLIHTLQRRQDRRHTAATVIGMRMRVCGLDLAVSVGFRFDPLYPDQVRLSFQSGMGKPAGTDLAIPHHLLAAGLTGLAEQGNARTRPSAGGRVLVITLTAPDGTTEFDAPAASIAHFLDATRRLVPPGANEPRSQPREEQIPVNLAEATARAREAASPFAGGAR